MKSILILVTILFSLNTLAADKIITIKVKGLVCSFCGQGIEKNFNKLKEVKATKVNLDKMEVKITLAGKEKLTEKKMKSTIE